MADYPGQYYGGWDSAGAQADWQAKGKNLDTLLQARGLSNSGGGGGNQSGGGGQAPNIDLVGQAQKLNDFYKQQNQPAIATQQTQIDPNNPNSIQARYDKILANIKGQSTVATNSATRSLTSGLGARGLMPDSPEGQRALDEGLLPTRVGFGGIEANAQGAESQEINQVNNAIAMLQRGVPESAVQTSLGYAGIQQQGFNLQAQLAAEQRRAETEAASRLAVAQEQSRIVPTGLRGVAYRDKNGNVQLLGGGGGNVGGNSFLPGVDTTGGGGGGGNAASPNDPMGLLGNADILQNYLYNQFRNTA